MTLFDIHHGYYDKQGNWHSTKKCFVHCGSSCDCGPPNGQYKIDPSDERCNHQEQLQEEINKLHAKLNGCPYRSGGGKLVGKETDEQIF